jgi:hypothetical protein
MRRILADHRAAQLGVSTGTVRHAYSRTAVSKPLEQSPPPAVKRYGLLAREERVLNNSAGCGNQALVPSVACCACISPPPRQVQVLLRWRNQESGSSSAGVP